jgi:integrase
LSVGIENYMNEKGSIRTRSVKEVEHSLNMMIEEWGDIGIGSITREMGTHFKSHLLKLPRNRKKNPEYRDKDLHELVEMNIKDTISSTTVNKHLQYVSSFYEWSVNHGYATLNPFKGMKLKRTVRPRDERDKFSELELKKIFGRDNYFHYTNIGDYIQYTNVEKGKYAFAYYWVPLIAVFTGMRLGEICPLYLDNVRRVEGHHRKRRWCFDIVEEPNRTDKRLKNQSSRRVVPIHDILIEQLGFIEFIELLKKKDPKRERLFYSGPHK